MSIRRQDIVDAVETRMKTILTTGGYHTNLGSNVFVWRTNPISSTELPCLIIKDTLSSKNQEGEGYPHSKDDWTLDVDLIVMVTNGNSSDVQLRQATADVYKAIGTGDTWSGYAATTTLVSDEVGLIEQQDKTVMGSVIKIKIWYRTNKYAES